MFNQDGSFSYSPDARYNGSDSFTFGANDRTVDNNIGTVSIAILGQRPVASNGNVGDRGHAG